MTSTICNKESGRTASCKHEALAMSLWQIIFSSYRVLQQMHLHSKELVVETRYFLVNIRHTGFLSGKELGWGLDVPSPSENRPAVPDAIATFD
jgi:hypothetical protein